MSALQGKSVVVVGRGGGIARASSLAVELAPIRVNAISPGAIDTDPARRIGTVDDVADAVI